MGTGASAGRFDGGVDLKLQRDGRVVLVQVKHWNAYKVPHNKVHQLIGLMVNARADAAILVTSGEFTKAAIEAATRNGMVQLIDGNELGTDNGARFTYMGANDARFSYLGLISVDVELATEYQCSGVERGSGSVRT